MRLFLIRHAQAGDRRAGTRDRYRPLSPSGHERARGIADLLAATGIGAILSSPATRCVQTVDPLAVRLGLTVAEDDALWEGSAVESALAAVVVAGHRTVVACSHGDLIPEIIETVAHSGATIRGRGCAKGSIWVVDGKPGRWSSARYLDRSATEVPPPIS
ncbi:MAG: histidine phosphatase family protein [Acidimicrobiales bacterium]